MNYYIWQISNKLFPHAHKDFGTARSADATLTIEVGTPVCTSTAPHFS